MKKLISAFLSVVMLLTCFTATFSAYADDNQCGENAYYFYNEETGVLSIKGTGEMYDYYDESNNAPWSELEYTEVDIAQGVTTIGNYAFEYSGVESIVLPKSLTQIGYNAFNGCYKLKSVEYKGTEDEALDIYIQSGNSYLTYNAEWTYHEHNYTTTIQKATIGTAGKIVKNCECGDVVTTTIAALKTITLSKTSYVYDGNAKKPTVTVKNTKGNTIKAENYTVTYPADCKNAGKHTVKVTFNNNYEGTMSAVFTISPKVGNAKTLYVGEKYTIPAKGGKSYSFKSSNAKVATVNKDGVVTAQGKGTATITITSGGVSSKVKITVKVPQVKINKTKASIKINKTVQLKLTTTPNGGTVSWKTSNKKIATVSKSGVVKGLDKGTVTITGTYKYKGKTYTKTCKVTVQAPKVKLNKTNATVYIKNSVQLKASVYPKGSKITWSSSDKKIATVSKSGKVSALKKGKVNITAKYTFKGKTYKAVCKVTVKNPELSETSYTIYNNYYFTLKVKGGSGKIKWSSSNPKVAYVNSNGKVSGVKAGTCKIIATRNGIKMTCTVTVSRFYAEVSYLRDLGAMFGVERTDDGYSDGKYIFEYDYDEIDKAAGSRDWVYAYTQALYDDGWSYYDDYWKGDTRYFVLTGYLYGDLKVLMIAYDYEDIFVIVN